MATQSPRDPGRPDVLDVPAEDTPNPPTNPWWLTTTPLFVPPVGVGRVHRSWEDSLDNDRKICTVCAVEKPVIEFYTRKATGEPLPACKICHRAKSLAYKTSLKSR